VLETARQRLAGLKSITPPPDFGNDLTLAGYETDIKQASDKLDDYNERLSSLDQLQNDFEQDEAALRVKNTRILSATEARYGPDSSEYEQAGGTRRSDRKRPGRRYGCSRCFDVRKPFGAWKLRAVPNPNASDLFGNVKSPLLLRHLPCGYHISKTGCFGVTVFLGIRNFASCFSLGVGRPDFHAVPRLGSVRIAF
jgi:hypothetical protein